MENMECGQKTVEMQFSSGLDDDAYLSSLDDAAWDLMNSVYCIGGTFEQWAATDEVAASKALECVKQLQVGQLVVDLALESVWTAFRREIVPLFWSSVCWSHSVSGVNSDTAILTRFHDALQLLQNSVVVLAPLIQRCEEVCRECNVRYRGGGDSNSLAKEMIVQLRAALHSQMPASAPKTVKDIYKVAFNVYSQLQLTEQQQRDGESEDEDNQSSSLCPGCNCVRSNCRCRALMNMLHEINKLTWSVGVANELCGAVAAGQLLQAVQKRVQDVCALPHDVSRLSSLQQWVKDASLGWLSVICSPEGPPPDSTHPLYRTCQNLMMRTFIHARISNLFSIVIDFPESRPAIEDLRKCLQYVDVHSHLVTTLRTSIQRRLLHPGVQTENVLHAYISIIMALKLLEPRGVILDLVTEPVRSYLRGRRDLVRYIVTRLTDGSGLYFSEDLITDTDGEMGAAGGGADTSGVTDGAAEDSFVTIDGEDRSGADIPAMDTRDTAPNDAASNSSSQPTWPASGPRGSASTAANVRFGRPANTTIPEFATATYGPPPTEWKGWKPDTIYARPRPPGDVDTGNKKNSSKELSNTELITMLVDIYGSKDMFISEYRAILADRLLSSLDYSKASVELETMHLELIKKRFGYNSPYISKIEVMIRDLNDSRSMNKIAHERLLPDDSSDAHATDVSYVSCLIVSNLFWPSFKDESFQLPEQALEFLKQYDKVFKETQRNKMLNWKHHLGQVELELEFENRTLDLKVTPGQAAVVMLFEKNTRLTLKEISHETKTTSYTARKLVNFWISQNVVREVAPETFELLEEFDAGSQDGSCQSAAMLALSAAMPEDELESAMASSDVQRQEEFDGIWLYIQGMLTNLDTLSLEKIHSMLLTFYVDEGGDCSLEELKRFLDQKVLQHQLILINGEYKLNK